MVVIGLVVLLSSSGILFHNAGPMKEKPFWTVEWKTMEFNYFVYKVLNVVLISLKVIVLFWNYKAEPDTGHIQTFEMKLFAMKAVVAKGSS